MTSNSITSEDFCSLFFDSSFESEVLRKEIDELVVKLDFSYRQCTRHEYNSSLLEILKAIDSNLHDHSRKHRLSRWESGWSENLEEFLESNFDVSALVPKYYRPSYISRFSGELVISNSPSFQYDFFQILRKYLALRYMKSFSEIYEFGCGPGHNLVSIASTLNNPVCKYIGLDWSSSAVETVNQIGKHLNLNCIGQQFDFYNPILNHNVQEDSLFVTFGGLEQVGSKFNSYLNFILEKKPALCINIEPINEFYDSDNLLDVLALRYHEKRNYLNNYLSKLLLLEKLGKIDIINMSRVPFGGLYHEGWNQIVWRPL